MKHKNFTQAELADVALLHDIVKLGIPDSILQKPGALTDRLREAQHTFDSAQIAT